jgi:hypothetical protein
LAEWDRAYFQSQGKNVVGSDNADQQYSQYNPSGAGNIAIIISNEKPLDMDYFRVKKHTYSLHKERLGVVKYCQSKKTRPVKWWINTIF